MITEYDEPPGKALLVVPCPECKKLLGLKETTNPEFVVFDEEEIPGDR